MQALLGLERGALDRARESRDARFDGKFFIAVTSTGVYCRPICPVKSPKVKNIRYYATAAEASEAGFRPCLRCRPETAPGSPAWHGASAVVRRAMRLIQQGALDRGSVEQLATRLGVGPRHLHRLFVDHVGASPIAVAQTRRLHFAKQLLDETLLPVRDVATASGFGSVRRLNEVFQDTYGRSPSVLRKSRRHPLKPCGSGEVVLRLAFRPPYDWSSILGFLATRALPGVEHVAESGYSRSVALGDRHAVVHVRAASGHHVLELHVSGASAGDLLEVSAGARRVFDLGSDPARVAAAFQGDALLRSLVARQPGLRVPGAWEPFECAVRAVLGQQVSVAAARTLAGRLVARFGRRIATSGSITHLFPTPEALAEAPFEGLGLTSGRARALKALAQAVRAGGVDFEAPTDEVMKALVALPGIGEWTAAYVAMRALGEPDAFPAADLVLRRAAGRENLPLTERALRERAEGWRPWRSYAAVHLWRSVGGPPAGRGRAPRKGEPTSLRS